MEEQSKKGVKIESETLIVFNAQSVHGISVHAPLVHS